MVLKRSAIKFKTPPAAVEVLDGWQVVLKYENQGKSPLLVDLSHCPCMDIQDKDIEDYSGLSIPAKMNGITRQENVFISRMNATQCQVMGLDGKLPALDDKRATDITGGQSILALVGKDVDHIMETLGPLDLFSPGSQGMTLCQAPVFHIPCQILVVSRSRALKVVIIAFARGYGQDMANAILNAGAPYDLAPGGISAISQWLEQSTTDGV